MNDSENSMLPIDTVGVSYTSVSQVFYMLQLLEHTNHVLVVKPDIKEVLMSKAAYLYLKKTGLIA